MGDYDAEDFERRALSGDWRAAVSVLSKAFLKPDVRSALMTPDAHDEIRIAMATRSDVAPEELAWAAATTTSTFILNRIVAHGTVSTSTIREIRNRALAESGEAWQLLAEYATRRLNTISDASGLHRGH